MKNGDNIPFRRFRRNGEVIPDPKRCEGKIRGISLGYAFCGEQDLGIRPLAKAFDALNDKMVIRKVPLEIVNSAEGVKAIKYGEDVSLNKNMIRLAKQNGMVGYWDSRSIIICAGPKYKYIIDSISEFIQPNRVHFAFETVFMGRGNLVIKEVE